jgi:uncharacterized damage-inducible protein DinB
MVDFDVDQVIDHHFFNANHLNIHKNMSTTAIETTKDLFIIKLAVNAWSIQNKRVDDLLANLSDERLKADTAPGRNSGVYLLGHLVATNDALLELFGLEKKHYPQLESIFLTSPDKSGKEVPSISDLKQYWKDVNETLTKHFNTMTVEDWLSRHTAVSVEDFAKEPHRNKLNVLLSRTTHQGYHLGQLIYLKEQKLND